MTTARTIRLLAKRELLDRLRNRAFVLGTLITVVLIVGGIAIPGFLADDGPDRFELGVVGTVPASFQDTLDDVAALQEAVVEVVALPDRDAAAAAVEDGDVDAALLDSRELMADGGPNLVLQGAVDAALQQASVAAELDALGMSGEELAGVVAARRPVTVVDTAGGEDEGFMGWMIAFAATALLLLTIQINAGSLLNGAIEEKSSRVIEVLLGSVRPWQLLAAKILAMTALALSQVGLLVGAALGANAVAGTVELPSTTPATAAVAALMILLGFVFYAALFAVAGSLASSAEDAQATAGPLGMALAAGYFLVLFAVIPTPRGVLSHVLTFLPPTAPFTVPARVALDAIPAWQVVVASLVTLVGAALAVRLSGRLYSASLLAGGKLTWRGAWRSEPIR